jgi:hypothetical protein
MDQPEELQARPPIRRPDVLARNCGSTSHSRRLPRRRDATLTYTSPNRMLWQGASLVVAIFAHLIAILVIRVTVG